MPELTTQASVRHARDLKFCYLCGHSFDITAKNHPDHLPPAAIFAKADKNFPLKVAAHRNCNNLQSQKDETIGQLIAVIHGKLPTLKNNKLKYNTYTVDEPSPIKTPLFGIQDTNLVGQIWRWVRGFHAALYSEFLPDNTTMTVHPPFPHGSRDKDGFTINKILSQQYIFVEIIKKNRIASRLDKIVCNNSKFSYECVWVQMDDRRWSCVFALNLYDWIKLADKNFETRGCTGMYYPRSGRPINGTTWATLEFPFSNFEPLDPFGK